MPARKDTPAKLSKTKLSQQEDIAALKEQVGALRDDLGALTDLMREMGTKRLNGAQSEAEDALSRLRGAAEDAEDKAIEQAQMLGARAEGFLRDQPGLAMALATGAGFIAGLFLARK